MKITSAMKMVSAAKLKKSQDQMQNIKPYSGALKNSINNLLPNISASEVTLLKCHSKENRKLIITISSNRGLCGGFNANIFKKAKQEKIQKTDDIYCIGKKIIEQFSRMQNNIVSKEIKVLDNPTAVNSRSISESIITGFIEGRWSEVILIYNKFKNAATQTVCSEKILPISIDENNSEEGPIKHDYIFEPTKKQIINSLIPEKVHTQIFEALLNSIASEHGARMTAMHKATDNAQDLKDGLTLQYNRQRQAAITNEILEIVAGAEALKEA
tara:strand:- start:33042 stop:33854 length:813 start_codon:yes stop_codon:yes gene_type:complete